MRRLEDERGATAVFVAILLVVLFGMGALVIDLGNLYWERRQLQNGADAAALAAALDHAAAEHDLAEDSARDLADANNYRGAFVEEYDPDLDESTVTVVSRTGNRDSGSRLDSWFANVIGTEDYLARASATAIWETAAPDPEVADLPVAASTCDFLDDPEGTTSPDALDEAAEELPSISEAEDMIAAGDFGKKIVLHGNSGQGGGQEGGQIPDEDDCTVDPGFSSEDGDSASGEDTMPAGFGYLKKEADPSCSILVDRVEDDGTFWADHEPGTSPGAAECIKDKVGQVVNIPVFINVDRAAKQYRLYTPAAFLLTGAHVTGGGPPSEPPSFSCDNNHEWCVQGHFVKKAHDGGDTCEACTNFGVSSVRLTD